MVADGVARGLLIATFAASAFGKLTARGAVTEVVQYPRHPIDPIGGVMSELDLDRQVNPAGNSLPGLVSTMGTPTRTGHPDQVPHPPDRRQVLVVGLLRRGRDLIDHVERSLGCGSFSAAKKAAGRTPST